MLHGPGLTLMVVNSKALSIWFSSMCLGGFLFQAIQEADAFFLVDRVVTDKLLSSFQYPLFCDIIWGVCELWLSETMDKCRYNYVVMFESV